MNEKVNSRTDLNPYFAKVIGFVSNSGNLEQKHGESEQFKLLINAGAEDGIAVGQRVLVFALGEEIIDPESNQSLGCFEIVRGEGKVESVQIRMAIIKSTKTVIQRRRKGGIFGSLSGLPSEEWEDVARSAPFDNPGIGDLVRFI